MYEWFGWQTKILRTLVCCVKVAFGMIPLAAPCLSPHWLATLCNCYQGNKIYALTKPDASESITAAENAPWEDCINANCHAVLYMKMVILDYCDVMSTLTATTTTSPALYLG